MRFANPQIIAHSVWEGDACNVSLEKVSNGGPMRSHLVLCAALFLSSCSSSSVTDSSPAPDPDVSAGSAPGCYAVVLGAAPAPDVYLPTLIELTSDPVPFFVEPGHFTVREPGTAEPRAPVSSWTAGSTGTIQLVLGGGFTGYSFSLRQEQGGWRGTGTYFADFGVQPMPGPLPLELSPRSCL
jgi:hypothetical protein